MTYQRSATSLGRIASGNSTKAFRKDNDDRNTARSFINDQTTYGGAEDRLLRRLLRRHGRAFLLSPSGKRYLNIKTIPVMPADQDTSPTPTKTSSLQREDKTSQPNLSIPCVSNITDNKRSCLARFMWSVVFVVCVASSLVQVSDRIQHYLKHPVSVKMFMERNNSLIFPDVTICRKKSMEGDVTWVKRKQKARGNDISNVTIDDIFRYFDYNLTAIYREAGFQLPNYIHRCVVERNKACSEVGRWTEVFTVMGLCYTFNMDVPCNISGAFHAYFLNISGNNETEEDVGWKIIIHPNNIVPNIEAGLKGYTFATGTWIDIRLQLKVFKAINTAEKPCDVKEDYSLSNCYTDCFNEKLFAILKCRMPYMQSDDNRQPCSTYDTYVKSKKILEDLIDDGQWKPSDCSCTRMCHEQFFEINIDDNPNDQTLMGKNIGIVRIFYEDLMFEKVLEAEEYSGIALMCDIGGSLGLFLGFSIPTFVELTEAAVNLLRRKCCLRRKIKPEVPVNRSVISLSSTHTSSLFDKMYSK